MIGASPLAQVVKNLPDNAGVAEDVGLIPGLGRSPERGNGNPLQCSCLYNPMDRWAWQATGHGVANNCTRLSMHIHACTGMIKRGLLWIIIDAPPHHSGNSKGFRSSCVRNPDKGQTSYLFYHNITAIDSCILIIHSFIFLNFRILVMVFQLILLSFADIHHTICKNSFSLLLTNISTAFFL